MKYSSALHDILLEEGRVFLEFVGNTPCPLQEVSLYISNGFSENCRNYVLKSAIVFLELAG